MDSKPLKQLMLGVALCKIGLLITFSYNNIIRSILKRKYIMKKTIEVVGAIIIDNQKILCAQRGPGKSLAHYWEFPGGKIEEHETPIEALKRELTEELLISVNVEEELFESTTYEYDFGFVHLTTFICHLIEGVPTLTEHVNIKWLPSSKLGTLEWAPADIPTVEKLKTTL